MCVCERVCMSMCLCVRFPVSRGLTVVRCVCQGDCFWVLRGVCIPCGVFFVIMFPFNFCLTSVWTCVYVYMCGTCTQTYALPFSTFSWGFHEHRQQCKAEGLKAEAQSHVLSHSYLGDNLGSVHINTFYFLKNGFYISTFTPGTHTTPEFLSPYNGAF